MAMLRQYGCSGKIAPSVVSSMLIVPDAEKHGSTAVALMHSFLTKS